jgi:SAM-dependent methyltransferase
MTSDNKAPNFNEIKDFWEKYSLKPENRWTSQSLFIFELKKLQKLLEHFPTFNVLDLGSGHGLLSKNLIRNRGTLVAVDNQNSYRNSFDGNPRVSFTLSDVQNYKSSILFDLVLLFVVITQMDIEIEDQTLSSIYSMLKPDGVAVIKHQCADKEGFVFNGFSKELGTKYSARYLSRIYQRERLFKYFSSVQKIEYPIEFKNWPNSTHVMFICKKNN